MSVIHEFDPVFNKDSKILILGTFPSVKSRVQGFYYGHPRNRFWKVLAAIYNENVPSTIEDKKAFLLRNTVAIWDVIQSCEIVGSSDSSIKNVVPNDLSKILENSNIEQIFTNGKKADELYYKYIYPYTKLDTICLPSTSPANASWNFDKLVDVWGKELTKF